MLETKLVRYLVCLALVLGFSATGARGGDILFIIDDLANLRGGDAVIKHFFEELGHTVMYFDDDEDEVTTECAAAAADLVYISESVISEKIENEITEIETPIIVAEPYCFYTMGMSSVKAADQRLDSVSIRIIEPDHPLAAGYSGNVAVLTEPDESTLIPGPSRAGGDAVVIAKGSGDKQKNADVYFVYDKGAALARPAGDGSGQVAADIRIGFFAASPKAQALLFLQGYDLLEAAVNYALGTTAGVKTCGVGNATIQEDTSASITLGGSDLDGDPLTYSVVTGPCHGCLSGTAPNLFYTPMANFNGSDSFTFKVNDGTADSDVATVLIMVTAVNDPPMANNDNVTMREDTLASITLTGSDLDGDPLTYSVLTGPCHGCLNGTPPNLIYTPKANFNGSDSFTFKVNDGTADSDVATVSITVTAVNDPPTVTYDSVTMQLDRPVVTIDLDTDVEEEPLTVTAVTQDTEGSEVVKTDSTLSCVPDAKVCSTDVVTETCTEGSEVVKTDSTLSCAPDAKVCSTDVVTETCTEGSEVVKTDSTLSCVPDAKVCSTDVATETCTEGSEAVKTDSTLSCVPDTNVCSTDVVTETCCEGEGGTEIATVNIAIKVKAVNAEPAITSTPVTAVEVGELYTYDVGATDPDVGDTLTYSLTAKPAGMTIEPDTGLIQWTPEGAHLGTNDIVVKVVDSSDIPASDTQSFTITVNPASLPPIITLTIADGYDEKDQKTLLANGKAGIVQASNDSWWETGFDSYTSYDFSDVSIPAGATIASVIINVEHFEEEQFSSGKLQWGIGTGWPSNPVVWTSTDAPVREGQWNEAIDSWDVTSFVDTPEKVNSLQLQIKNNDNDGKRKTLVNYIYAVVKWY